MSYISDLRNTYLKDEYKHIAIQGNVTGLIIYRRTVNKELEVLAQVRGDVVVHTVVVYAVDYDNVAGDIKEDGVETLASTWLTENEIRQLLENAEDNFFHNNIHIFRDIVERFSKVL